MDISPKLPTDPDELKLPDHGNTSDDDLRPVVWKWLGIPEELWPMAELLNLLVTRRRGLEITAPKRSEFILAIPRPSNPRESVKFNCTDDCHTWGEEGWRYVFTQLVDYARDTR